MASPLSSMRSLATRIRRETQEMPDPAPTSFFDHVYVEDTPRLIKDRDTYATYLESFDAAGGH